MILFTNSKGGLDRAQLQYFDNELQQNFILKTISRNLLYFPLKAYDIM